MRLKFTLPENHFRMWIADHSLFCRTARLFVDNMEKITSYSVPDGTTRIANDAMAGLENLKEIRIPDSVESIGENAFLSCKSLETIHWGNGLRSIETNAFIYCNSLTEIVFPDSLTSKRHQSYFGPDSKRYHGAGAYKPYKVTSMTALLREWDYVLVDMSYSSAGRQCVYFRSSSLTNAAADFIILTAHPARTIVSL